MQQCGNNIDIRKFLLEIKTTKSRKSLKKKKSDVHFSYLLHV